MKFDAVLFDLDGTLLDTIEDLADSMNAVLEQLGCPTHDVEAYKRFVGDGVDTLARRTLPGDKVDPQTVEYCVRAMSQQYAKRWNKKTRPYDGIPQLLDGLTARGLRMAVLSNKPHEFTTLCVEQLLPKWRFEAVLGVSDGVARKPDPSGALRIARLMQLDPCRFLYLGDTNTDMLTARAAGMYAVGAAWGFRSARELLETGAQALARGPLDVLPLL